MLETILHNKYDHPIDEGREFIKNARIYQNELDRHQFVDSISAKKAAETIVEILEQEWSQSDIAMPQVRLLGEDVRMPKFMRDPDSGAMTVHTVEPERKAGDFVSEPSVSGGFYGFASIIETVRENGIDIYVPKIVYQVDLGRVTLPNFVGNMTGYGKFETCEVEFISDRQQIEMSNALFAYIDMDNESVIRELASIVDRPHSDSAQGVRSLAVAVRTFLQTNNDVLAQRHKDALLDCVKAKLNLCYDQQFTFKCTSAYEIKYDTPKDALPTEMMIKPHGTKKLKDVIYAPTYTFAEGRANFNKDQLGLYAIAELNDGLLYIPLERVITFETSGSTDV